MSMMSEGLNAGEELARSSRELPDEYAMSQYYSEYAAGLIVGYIGYDVGIRNLPDYVTASCLYEEYEKYSVKSELLFEAIRMCFDREYADEVIHAFKVKLEDDDDY